MLTLTDRPLSLEMKLSPGAHQLYNVTHLAPGQTQKFYAQQMGYSDRRVRTFAGELVTAGLAERVRSIKGKGEATAHSKPLPNHQSEYHAELLPVIVQKLIAFGIVPPKARMLADRYSVQTLEEALRQAQRGTDVHNPPGYLIWWLNACPPDAQTPPESEPLTEVTSPIESALTVEPDLTQPEHSAAQPIILSTVSAPTLMIVNASPAALPNEALLPPGEIVVTDANREIVLLAYAVEQATGTDIRLNFTAQQVVRELHRFGYTADEVAHFRRVFALQDWRGRKSEPPTPKVLLEQIGVVRVPETPAPVFGADSLSERVYAIRSFMPSTQTVCLLSDLWSTQVRAALDAENLADSPLRAQRDLYSRTSPALLDERAPNDGGEIVKT